MPGFPLAAIGAGIGQGVQQIDQHQQAMIQRALAQLAMQQQQQQLQAQGAAGAALPGLAGMLKGPSPISPLGAGGMPGTMPGGQMASPPMAPQTPPPIPAGLPAPNQSSQGQFTSGDDGTQPGIGAAGDNMSIPLDTPDPVASPAPQTSGQTPPATQMSPQSGGAGGSGMTAPISNPGMQSLIGPQVDLGQIVQAIQAARPDADPGTVFRATTMLYEMLEKGNVAQQNTAIRAYTALMAQQRLGQQGALGQERIDTTRRGQDLAAQGRSAALDQRGQIAAGVSPSGAPTVAAQSLAQRKQEAASRREDAKARADAAAAKGDTATAFKVLKAHLDYLKSSINSLLANVPDSPARDQSVKEMQKDASETQARMNKLPGAASQSQ